MVSPFSPAVVVSLTEYTLSAFSSFRNALTWSSSSCSSRCVAKILMGVVKVLTLIMTLLSAAAPQAGAGVAMAARRCLLHSRGRGFRNARRRTGALAKSRDRRLCAL